MAAVIQARVPDTWDGRKVCLYVEERLLLLFQLIHWYSWDLVLRNRERINFYITTDFATSDKQSGDFSFISVWAYNNNRDWFWVDGVCKKQLMDANINDLFRLSQKYQPQSVGIEVTGQQGGFMPWIQDEMIRRNVYFHLASDNNDNDPGIRPSTNKMQRFNVTVPWFKAGKVYLRRDMKDHPAVVELVEELELVCPEGFKSRNDDGIDTVSMLPLMNAMPPSEIGTLTDAGDPMWGDAVNDDESAYSSYIV